ncbi:hypothetical protein L6452_33708 [Arctium lappa]|uniref:Uncharacterized protein n=1 Tax=Arctium lappa TaxID=4217 RepID=A0ACB8YGR0_ARCLA|nr:hypothetical protein L6452_33708 [Arctium lappa]
MQVKRLKKKKKRKSLENQKPQSVAMIHVKHLQWKFRGNESIHLKKVKIEVYWDVHDWLFSPGLRHALFVVKPMPSTPPPPPLVSLPLSPSPTGICCSVQVFNSTCSYEFCLCLHAWKVE